MATFLLVVKRSEFQLEVWKRRTLPPRRYDLLKTIGISIGMKGHETPADCYYVIAKARYPEWRMPDSDWVKPGLRGTVIPGDSPKDPHPENPIKEAFLRLTEDGVGIHGTEQLNSLGTAASHGCIRVTPRHAVWLHRRIKKLTPVVIL